ncbi:hypothetical protein HY375_03720 [Candidatus Berkelbacteria bacterium]|nr:hypothetical protein [Candidatus Berkelbacteria bacterium]
MARARRFRLLGGLVVLVVATGLVWLFLRASADSPTPSGSASSLPRSGVVQGLSGDTVTLVGAEGVTFVVALGQESVIRLSDGSGPFEPATRADVRVGQLATVAAELPGAPVGALDLIEKIGGTQ